MTSAKGEETALGTARGRFLDALPDKCAELGRLLGTLRETPDDSTTGEELRRRLQALYASSLVFRSEALTALTQQAIACTDGALSGSGAFAPSEVERLSGLVEQMAALRQEGQLTSRRPGASLLSTARVSQGLRPSAAAMRASLRLPSAAEPQVGLSLSSAAVAPELSLPPAGVTPQDPAVALLPSSLPPAQPEPEVQVEAEVRPETEVGPEAKLRVETEVAPGLATERVSLPAEPLLQRVLRVLAVADAVRIEQLRALLGDASLRLEALESAEEALARARRDAPDVILIDEAVLHEADLVATLRADALTDFVPVVVWARSAEGGRGAAAVSTEADGLVWDPLDHDALMHMLGFVSGTLIEPSERGPRLVHATMEEVADRVAEEVRRGLVDAADCEPGLRIPFGSDLEVRAAAWAAVARVRALASERSAGRVQFRDGLSGPAPLVLAAPEASEDAGATDSGPSLRGRRVLIVDDDPAVVAFFAGLLLREGAVAREAKDGHKALLAARAERPDLVISDVLMPHVDGFTLCRELKRDPLLADVPVILISWKQDLLVRMRELSSGADGYLCKEADAAQILSGIRAALRARTEIEAELAKTGEARGELEGIGVIALLSSVAQTCKDAQVTLRDAWNLLECEIRDGRIVQVTRTAADGSFARGARALPQLVGMLHGHYTVQRPSSRTKVAFESSLEATLRQGAEELDALLSALRPPTLSQVKRVAFDEDAYAMLCADTPPPARDIIERLAAGAAPAQLCREGRIAASVLEPMLADLARRGAICAVLAESGEDLAGGARASAPSPDGPPGHRVSLPSVLDPEAWLADAERGEPDAGLASPVVVEEPIAEEAAAAAAAEPATEPPVEEEDATPVATPSSPPGGYEESDDDTKTREVASEERRSRTTLLAWALALVCVVALGVVLEQLSAPPGEGGPTRIEAIGARRSEGAAQGKSRVKRAKDLADLRSVGDGAGGILEYEGLLERGVEISAEQGLLVLDPLPGLAEATVSVDGSAEVKLPASLPLDQGPHELQIRHGDAVTYRFFSVTPGHTFALSEL